MDHIFLSGLIGSLVLVAGAAWPVRKKIKHPMQSTKNWLFAVGGLIMLLYSLLGYWAGGSIFFVFLEALVVLASVLMMLNAPDRWDVPIIGVASLAMMVWSLWLFQDLGTVMFVLGLGGVGLGYALEMGTARRNLSLMLGSILVALFSYIEASWIFFWLNVFFAAFSAMYFWKLLRKNS